MDAHAPMDRHLSSRACAGLGRAWGGGVRVVVEVAQTLYDDDNEDDDIWRLTSQYHDVSSAFYHI